MASQFELTEAVHHFERVKCARKIITAQSHGLTCAQSVAQKLLWLLDEMHDTQSDPDCLRGRLGKMRFKMLWTVAVVFLILWFLGLITSYTMGGLIHILLVLAVVTVLVRIIQGRKILT